MYSKKKVRLSQCSDQLLSCFQFLQNRMELSHFMQLFKSLLSILQYHCSSLLFLQICLLARLYLVALLSSPSCLAASSSSFSGSKVEIWAQNVCLISSLTSILLRDFLTSIVPIKKNIFTRLDNMFVTMAMLRIMSVSKGFGQLISNFKQKLMKYEFSWSFPP